MKPFWWRWAPALVWMGVIWLLSAQPGEGVSLPFSLPDKVCHAGLYGVLGLALFRALATAAAGRESRAFILGAAWGASDEWHQSFVPRRMADPLDWLADLVGLALGLALATYWARRRGGDRGLP